MAIPADVTQVGLGVTVAILLLREVRGILRERKNGNGLAGEKSVDYWKNVQSEVLRNELRPFVEQQAEAMQGIRDNLTKLTYIAERYWK
jgi:hypothetical protein